MTIEWTLIWTMSFVMAALDCHIVGHFSATCPSIFAGAHSSCFHPNALLRSLSVDDEGIAELPFHKIRWFASLLSAALIGIAEAVAPAKSLSNARTLLTLEFLAEE